MIDDDLIKSLNRLIVETEKTTSKNSTRFLKECRDRLISVHDLEAELVYYITMAEQYERLFESMKKEKKNER